MEYNQPSTVNLEKKLVIVIIAIIISAAIGYMGYRQFIKWHKSELQTAVIEEHQKMAEKNTDLEYQIIQLNEKVARLKPPPVPDDRISEVFGKSHKNISTEPDHSCDAMEHKITAFFKYLQKNSYVDADQTEKSPSDVFFKMMQALSAHPPMIVDETRDIVNLKHNQAHFFRILRKDRIKMVRNILAAENDVLEHAMADFYTYYITGDCCKNDDEPCVSLNTLYEYAGFFINTFAGKSYLFRRSSAIRCLTDYYAVLVLDRANDAGINRYGIDIRPHINLALNNIISQNNLIFQDQYIKTLIDLNKKYNR